MCSSCAVLRSRLLCCVCMLHDLGTVTKQHSGCSMWSQHLDKLETTRARGSFQTPLQEPLSRSSQNFIGCSTSLHSTTSLCQTGETEHFVPQHLSDKSYWPATPGTPPGCHNIPLESASATRGHAGHPGHGTKKTVRIQLQERSGGSYRSENTCPMFTVQMFVLFLFPGSCSPTTNGASFCKSSIPYCTYIFE